MDLYCQVCGEPWELSYLPEFEIDDYRGAKQDFLNGVGCPTCNWGQKAPAERPRQSEFMAIAREELGSDLDGIAAEMEDLEYMGFFREELYGASSGNNQ